MAYTQVQSLDCDTVTALGGVNKHGEKNPTSIEGYYLGSRQAKTADGVSTIHVFQTPKGNHGIWGSADTNTKLARVNAGTMTLVEFKEKKKIAGGKTKKIFAVSQDHDNTIEVTDLTSGSANEAYIEDRDDVVADDEGDEAFTPPPGTTRPSSASKVQELLNRNKNK